MKPLATFSAILIAVAFLVLGAALARDLVAARWQACAPAVTLGGHHLAEAKGQQDAGCDAGTECILDVGLWSGEATRGSDGSAPCGSCLPAASLAQAAQGGKLLKPNDC